MLFNDICLMEFIYTSYFQLNPYPSLVLKPDNDSNYIIYDVNQAFLDNMEIERDSILHRDLFGTLLKNEKNVTSVVAALLKTTLAYVKTYCIPREINNIPIRYINNIGKEKYKSWDISNYPVIDEDNNLIYLLLMAKEIPEFNGKNIITEK